MAANLNQTTIPYTKSNNDDKLSEYETFKRLGIKKNRKGRKWSDEEDADLIREVKNHPIEQIAEIHGRTATAITMHLQEIASRMKEQKIDTAEIKQQLNLKDEDLLAAEKREKAREANSNLNIAESLDGLYKKIDGLEALVLSQNKTISEMKALIELLTKK